MMMEHRHKWGWQAAAALTIAGVATFAAVIYLSGLDKIDSLLGTDPRFAGLACAAGLGVTVTSALRWRAITNSLVGRKTFTFVQYYASLIISRVFGLFLPRGSTELGVRFVALATFAKTGNERAATSVALDRLFDLLLWLAWLAPSLLILSGAVPWEMGAVLLPVATVAAILVMLRLSLVVRWTARRLSSVLGALGGPQPVRSFAQARARNLGQLAEVEHLPSRQALFLSGLTVLRYGLNSAMFYMIALSLGLEISFYTFLLAGSLIQLTGLVAITPGGLGIVEVGWFSAFTLAGVAGEDVAVFVVGQRAFQYTFFTILGGLCYVVISLPSQRRVRPQPTAEVAAERHP